MKKRFGSILLTLALLVGLMPWAAMPARAGASYVAQIGETGYATVQEAIDVATSGQTVQLIADVVTDSTITVSSGKSVTLDLNDHCVRYTGTGSSPVITLNGGALTLDDRASEKTARFVTLDENGRATAVAESGEAGDRCLAVTGGLIAGGTGHNGYGTLGGGVYVDAAGTFTMNGGTICGNAVTASGGGVYVANDCAFTMNGGTIYHNTASDGFNGSGGGVYVNGGKFHMTGGSISDNTAADDGGGVYVTDGGEFHMSGTAKLSGNTARHGGGVRVFSNGTFTMESGATVSGNNTTEDGNGGGVYVNGTFTMNGGAISGNNAGYDGGGVYVEGTFTMTDGTISGNNTTEDGGGVYVINDGTFNVSGGATVTGNKLGGTFENGSLTGGTANNAYLFVGNMITVAGALSSNASISVTAVEEAPRDPNADPYADPTYQTRTGAFTSGLASGGTNALACFASDVEGYAVGLNAQGEAALAVPVTVTYDANDGAGTMAAQKLPSGLAAALSANSFTRAGYSFAGWNTQANGTGTSYADKASVTLTADTTLYAQWGATTATAPAINTQPQNLSLTYGYSTGNTLTVAASAAEGHTLSYQWYSNTSKSSEGGTPIENATTASYTVPTGKSAGTTEYYYCVVTATRTDNSKTAATTSSVATVTVKAKAVTAAMISAIAAQTYTGKEIKPTVTVKDGQNLTPNTDYTVAYSSNTDPGTATVTVTGKGNYTGTATATFQIYGVKGAWENSKLKATVNVSDPANALLIAAVYDKNGKQVDVKVVGLAANKTAYETGVTTKTSGYTYKLMVVSKSTYAPLCAAWSEKA